jgi:hypothetical protein
MADTAEIRHTLGELAARQLANTTKTVPQMRAITPRVSPALEFLHL